MPVDNFEINRLNAPIPYEHVIFTDLDGIEGVLVDLNSRKYYQLNETAALVWRGLEKQLSVEKIADEMTTIFDVPRDRAASSVERLLRSLYAYKLVRQS